MPLFSYSARSANHALVHGVIEAESQSAAVKQLGGQGYFPIRLGVKTTEKKSSWTGGFWRAGVTTADLSLVYRQLADLLHAGLPLASVLKMTAEQADHALLREALTGMASAVREGSSLSEAMSGHPLVFSHLHGRLVHAGEAGGRLEQALERLADLTEREGEIQAQLKAALAYPLFIVVVGICTIVFLMGVIIPKMAVMFSEFQQNLPWPTRALLSVSGGIHSYWWIFLILAGMVWAALNRPESQKRMKIWKDKILFNAPLIKSWVLKREISSFARTLGSLLQNGVAMLSALQTSVRSLDNHFFQKRTESFLRAVEHGESLSSCLRKDGLFPPYVCNMAAVGEEGGRLPEALLKIADSYERQSHRDLKVAVSLIEPALILAIGALLGAIVISIMLPIFEINTLIR